MRNSVQDKQISHIGYMAIALFIIGLCAAILALQVAEEKQANQIHTIQNEN